MNMSSLNCIRALCAGLLLVCLYGAAYAGNQKTAFDLPAQALAESLRAVGSKASVNVVFDPSSVRGKSAPTLRGAYSAREALERLLDGSGLGVRVTDGGSFVVEALLSGDGKATAEGFNLARVEADVS